MPEPEIGERVARVETKIEGIEEGIRVIRSTGHQINGEMQKFVLLEEKCVSALSMISEQTAHLPEIAQAFKEFTKLQPKIEGLLEIQQQKSGAWKSWAIAAAALVGAVAIIHGLVVAFVEFWRTIGAH